MDQCTECPSRMDSGVGAAFCVCETGWLQNRNDDFHALSGFVMDDTASDDDFDCVCPKGEEFNGVGVGGEIFED